MNAVTYSAYGGPEVLEYREVATPTPDDDEVLVDIQAASVNAGDWHLMRGSPVFIRLLYGGLLKPGVSILGNDVTGRVEAVGKNVTQFQPGDEVVGDVSEDGFGGFAEYVCASESVLVPKPASVSFEAAAAVPTAGVTALQGLRNEGQIQSGQNVVVNGASGGVGTFAIQIAKSFGAEVTGVCSTPKVDVVRSIGANHVIDYTQEDFTKSGQRYDLVLDIAAAHSLRTYLGSLRPDGRYLMVGGPSDRFLKTMALGPLVSSVGSRKVGIVEMEPNMADLASVLDLLESGDLRSVIDRQYSLREVPEAIRYLESGHATGKVVIA